MDERITVGAAPAPVQSDDRFDGEIHEPDPPGEAWQYSDVQVNLLALSLLHVLRDPLQEVLREEIMDPIRASRTWRWHGYEGSWVTVEGQRMQSPSGGGHWAGACGSAPGTRPASGF